MIIDEKYVHTKVELENLFNKLSRNGFIWSNSELLSYRPNFDLPVYIHLYNDKRITWCTHSIPQSYWEYYL